MLKEIKYDDIKIGDSSSIERKVTQSDIEIYSKISGDTNPLHTDAEYAKKTIFGKIIAHGSFTASMISAVLATKLPGPGYIYISQEVKFLKPVYPGDTIKTEVVVTKKIEGKKILELNTTCKNQKDEIVLDGKALVMAPRIAEKKG